jgi:hypothetical protein
MAVECVLNGKLPVMTTKEPTTIGVGCEDDEDALYNYALYNVRLATKCHSDFTFGHIIYISTPSMITLLLLRMCARGNNSSYPECP